MTSLLSMLDRFERATAAFTLSSSDEDEDELHAARRAILEAFEATLERARTEGAIEAFEETASRHDEDAQEYNKQRDPGMANHQRKYAKAFRDKAATLRDTRPKPSYGEEKVWVQNLREYLNGGFGPTERWRGIFVREFDRLLEREAELVKALEAQMASTTMLLTRHGYDEQTVSDCTSQARRALHPKPKSAE